jgi:hypothetical protein
MSVFDDTTYIAIKAFAMRYATYIHGTTGCGKSANFVGSQLDKNVGAGKDNLIECLKRNGHSATSWPEARALALETIADLDGWTA